MVRSTPNRDRSLLITRIPMVTLLVAVGSSLAGGCSDSLSCKPPIREGATYRVTLLAETTNSQKCHVVDGIKMSPFQVTAGKTEPTAAHPDCAVVTAVAAPEQMDVGVESCVPGETDMLSIRCNIKYKSTCEGMMWFSFAAPDPSKVNWGASVIDGVIFMITDRSDSCLGGVSDCTDEYNARLELMP